MNDTTPAMNRLLIGFVGFAFVFPTIFFAFYSIRLLVVNLQMTPEEAALHRTSGMLIGAVAFPLVMIVCGWISFLCFRTAVRGFRSDRKER